MNIYTIHPSCSFLDVIAKHLVDEHRAKIHNIAEIEIFLPTTRACRILSQSIKSYHPRSALPRIQSIEAEEEGEGSQALTPLTQRILMTQLLSSHAVGRELSLANCTKLANCMLQLVNQMHKEQISLSKIQLIFPELVALHLQNMLELLEFATSKWPKLLASRGLTDYVQAQNLQMEQKITRLQQKNSKIIAAGSTASSRPAKNLLKAVAQMPLGTVILPGLDLHLKDEDWQNISVSHPQYYLKTFLEEMNVSRERVKIYGTSQPFYNLPREKLISSVMMPSFQNLQEDISAISGITLIAAEQIEQEANIIALMLRRVAEENYKTAVLITNDTHLAKRVTIQLQKWDIAINNSLDNHLVNSPAIHYLQLIMAMIMSNYSPVALLSLLKHPFAKLQQGDEYIALLAELEINYLRKVRNYKDLSDLLQLELFQASEALQLLMSNFAKAVEPLAKIYTKPHVNFNELLAAHLLCAVTIAGEEVLWGGERGEALKVFFTNLQLATGSSLFLCPTGYSELFDSFLAGHKYSPAAGLHPRLDILTPTEARLSHYNLLILAGLNESSWPSSLPIDPFLNLHMRKTIGLSSPEISIGKSAHDFYLYLHGAEVVLSRSCKIDGCPAIKSRWLHSLEIILNKMGWLEQLKPDLPWSQWARDMYIGGNMTPFTPALEPKPPLSYRPKKLSVTKLELLLRNPYAIYVQEILKIKTLEPLDKTPGPAEFGNFIHHTIESFITELQRSNVAVDKRQSLLINCGLKHLRPLLMLPIIKQIWWPRFENIASWLIDNFFKEEQIPKIFSEERGSMTLETDVGPFTINCKADLLSVRGQHLNIIDFKTGQVPTATSIKRGLAPQLTLEAMVAQSGGFSNIAFKPTLSETTLCYVHLTGGVPAGKIYKIEADVELLVQEARKGLLKLLNVFEQESTPYLYCPNPSIAPKYNDYVHLSRIKGG